MANTFTILANIGLTSLENEAVYFGRVSSLDSRSVNIMSSVIINSDD